MSAGAPAVGPARPVTQPVTSPNPEDEEEAAIEMVHLLERIDRG